MSTRGLYGFYKNGVNKLTYNHSDSCPSGLGNNILSFLKNMDINELNNIFDNIQLVDESDYPNEEEEKQIKELGYSINYRDKKEDWFGILASSLGDISVYKEGLTFMLDYNDFILDGLYCEWAYVINLDENCLEIYKGLSDVIGIGRYAEGLNDGSRFGCTLIKSINLDSISNIDSLEKYLNS